MEVWLQSLSQAPASGHRVSNLPKGLFVPNPQ